MVRNLLNSLPSIIVNDSQSPLLIVTAVLVKSTLVKHLGSSSGSSSMTRLHHLCHANVCIYS